MFDGIKNLWESVCNLPSLIWNSFKASFDTLWNWLKDIFNKIVELPKNILDGIKEVFIPDTNDINTMFNSAMLSIRSKFGFQEFDFNNIASGSATPTDIAKAYTINGLGTMNLKFFDTKYLIQGVEFFRPFIRGFIVLLLIFYNAKMFLGFIGHNVGKGESSE